MRSRLLFLAHLLPWPLHGGGQIVSHGLLASLARTHDVTLLSFIRADSERAPVAEHLAPLCVGGVRLVRLRRGGVQDAAALIRSSWKGTPFLIERDGSAMMQRAVTELIAANCYDIVLADHLQMMKFVPMKGQLQATNLTAPRIVLNQHNAETRLYERMAGLPILHSITKLVLQREAGKLRQFETAACRRADEVRTLSRDDANALGELSPKISREKIAVVPMEAYVPRWPRVEADRAGSRTLLFVGTLDWPPNRDALLWFCHKVLPIIRQTVPDALLTIVGARADVTATRLGNLPGVRFVGFVQDLTPFVAKSAALVVPLRAGGGVRVKIITARWMGLPVVTTPLGAEGLGTIANAEDSHQDAPLIVAAPNVRDFATACISALSRAASPRQGDID